MEVMQAERRCSQNQHRRDARHLWVPLAPWGMNEVYVTDTGKKSSNYHTSGSPPNGLLPSTGKRRVRVSRVSLVNAPSGRLADHDTPRLL